MLLTPLEQRFPEQVYPANIQGIIVLGGSYDTVGHGYMSSIVLQEDTEPLAVMVDLARRYPEAKIIFSGGTTSSVRGPSEADIVKGYFVSFGIAPDRILTEGESQTTEENARFTDALVMAIWRRGRPDALLHHSDRGSQYTSEQFQRLMADHGVVCSMSRSGNVWDNAAMESFFSSLKIERTTRRMYQTRDDAKADVFDYIERFYNPKRRHSTIGYLSPMEFERQVGLA